MTSYIKRRVAEKLSLYFKDMTPDRFSLSFFKGEASLENLQVQEGFLHEALYLPSWLVVRKGKCSKVSCRMSMMRLKSQPICITIENVVVWVQAMDPSNPHLQEADQANAAAITTEPEEEDVEGEKYGTADMIADGLTVRINDVSILVDTPDCSATVELRDIDLASVSPGFEKISSLKESCLYPPGKRSSKATYVTLHKLLTL
eukprot:m.256642 g.256642  ORF g.256642 m.256642 type:complete len:203 (-) comp15523_c0_seq1:1148-1756(-)